MTYEYAGLKFIYLDQALTHVFYCFIFFVILFTVSKLAFTYLFFTKTYNALSFKKKLDWDCRIPSTVNALGGVYFTYYTWVHYPAAFDDFFNFFVSDFSIPLSFTCGYFIQDIFIVIYEGDIPMLIHHTLGITGLLLSSTTGLCGPVLVVYLGTEITTPFLNLRYYLSELGYKDSMFYILNGLIGTIFWFVFRIGVIPYFYWQLYVLWDRFIENTPIVMVYTCLFYATSLNLLNTFWFYKIMSGLLKIISGDGGKKDKKKE